MPASCTGAADSGAKPRMTALVSSPSSDFPSPLSSSSGSSGGEDTAACANDELDELDELAEPALTVLGVVLLRLYLDMPGSTGRAAAN